jgi:general secretion pathway protein C
VSALLDRLQLQSVWWPRLALAAAAALLLWVAVRLFWLLLAGPDLPPPPPVALDGLRSANRSSASISQWHLFGSAGAGFDPRLLANEAPETALRLTLRGTLSEHAADGGIAIIADEHGVERGYRVGDALPGDARLEAIYAGRVLLSRGGVNESLSLPRGDPGGRARSTAAAPGGLAAPAPPRGRLDAFVNPMISTGVPLIETPGPLTGVNLDELAKQVNVMPVLENGRFAGVRLSVSRDSDLLARTGLRSTDVVVAVNGVPLDGPQRQLELLNSLRDARQVTVTVRRDGETKQIPIGF